MAYASLFYDKGFAKSDEGVLGYFAERVANGDLPQREYLPGYTGGLDFFNTLMFKMLGASLRSLRVPLIGVAAVVAMLTYAITAKLTAGPLALEAGLLAITWGVPIYAFPLPSWYNLMFCLGGIFCCIRFVETRRMRWIAFAGALAGVSFLAKQSGGLFNLGSLLMFLVLWDAWPWTERHETTRAPSISRFAGVVILLGIAVALFFLLSWHLTLGTFAIFGLLPLMCLVFLAALLFRGRAAGAGDGPRQSATWLIRGVALALGGFAFPLVCFGLVYVVRGAVGELLDGVFLRAAKYLGWYEPFRVLTAPGLIILGAILGWAFLVAHGMPWRLGAGKIGLLLASGVAGLLLVLSLIAPRGRLTAPLHAGMWQAAYYLPLIAYAMTLWLLVRKSFARRRFGALQTPGPGKLLIAGAVLCYGTLFFLLQFPASFAGYQVFTFPPAIILGSSLLARADPAGVPPTGVHGLRRAAVLVIPVGFIVFSVLFNNLSVLVDTTKLFREGRYLPRNPVFFDIPRAQIYATGEQVEVYTAVVQWITERVAPSEPIFVYGDAPEVYFLAGRRNPTRFHYVDITADHREIELMLERLDRDQVKVFIVRRGPRVIPPHLAAAGNLEGDPRILGYIDRCCRPAATYGEFTIYTRDGHGSSRSLLPVNEQSG